MRRSRKSCAADAARKAAVRSACVAAPPAPGCWLPRLQRSAAAERTVSDDAPAGPRSLPPALSGHRRCAAGSCRRCNSSWCGNARPPPRFSSVGFTVASPLLAGRCCCWRKQPPRGRLAATALRGGRRALLWLSRRPAQSPEWGGRAGNAPSRRHLHARAAADRRHRAPPVAHQQIRQCEAQVANFAAWPSSTSRCRDASGVACSQQASCRAVQHCCRIQAAAALW